MWNVRAGRRARPGGPASGARWPYKQPTAELERALRDQLHYSHTLDEDIMEQILSASSDEREDIPRLALNSSNRSTSSIHSSSSERLHRLRSDNEKLELQVNNLECRLKDKDALITELNRVRDSLSQQCQAAGLRLEAERDNSARLALLLDSHKDSADTLHNQDSSMIDMLKRRLESAMKCDADVQEREQALLRRLRQLERAPPAAPDAPTTIENEKTELAREISSLRRCLTADSPDAASDKQQVQQLQQQVRQLRAQLEARSQQLSNDEKEQAVNWG
ncbi:jg20226 [Pararge aegeria aegeria]|uniref:Jg20226 protein n=1 Tax=Pararge aegeria aegeria TaxID=348720 RepID=A0A8S4R6Q9_9NEOP|nr:jg20226 [Pararge aegeria aegeria]